MKIQLLSLPLVLIVVATTSTEAQEARPDDVSSVDGIIQAYYEVVSGPAGEAPDAARDRSLHHPDAWVAIAGSTPDGERVVNVMGLDDYHGDNGPRSEGFFEWETDRVVNRSGNMVHVWSSYASARSEGGEPFEHGVNSITLFHDGSRWWIMGWMFDSAS
ncbi:MAG: nuclear transport factor 2 family protein [Longimicrobiales bacterium]